jgi:excisionase family DNA binding protein
VVRKSTQNAYANNSTAGEEILTIGELSAHLRVHPTTIYRLLREGRIPGFRVGSAWRFSRSAIENWERSGPDLSDPEPPPRVRRQRARKARK